MRELRVSLRLRRAASPVGAVLGLAALLPGSAAAQLRGVDPVSGRPVVAECGVCRVETDPGCLPLLRAGGSFQFGRVDFRWTPADPSGDLATDPLDSIEDHPPGGFASLAGSPLDPLWNELGPSTQPANAAAELSELYSATLAGESSSTVAGLLGLLSILQTNRTSAAELPVPLRATNRDLRDGVMTSLGPSFDRDGIPYNPDSPDDLLSLDSTLSAEQRALLGCGPFYGTRCDRSAVDRAAGFSGLGGVDLRHAELGALAQALPATLAGEIGYRSTRLGAHSSDPGGIEVDGACLRHAPGDPLADDLGRVRLPGCRGIVAVLTQDLARLPAGAPIELLFERGYAPGVDGCVLGASDPGDPESRGVAIAGHPVRAMRLRPRDDAAFDARDPVGSAEDISALLNATCGGSGDAEAASSTRIGTPGYAGLSLFRRFAQTAWHPLAGCRTRAQAHDPSDAVRRCDFSRRDFEREFLEGSAELFRSELAAVSWNFLVLLVLTSCDGALGGDDLRDPECFDPRPPGLDADGQPYGGGAWAPDRCSLAAPQLCRKVRPLLEATRDEDGDGIPDSLELDASCGPVRASPAVLWPPRKGFVAVALEPGPALGGAELQVIGVTQDEASRREGRRWQPSARIDGDGVWLEADRSGSGNGRVYRLTYTAERPVPGSCGATTRCIGSVEVCVPRGRKQPCRDDGQRWDATAR